MTALPTTQAPGSFPLSPTHSDAKIDSAAEIHGPIDPVAINDFIDRRSAGGQKISSERRQFANSYSRLSPEARQLAEAIDQYKADHRRRYITFEEMLQVIVQLGYRKQD